ncbi:MAG: Mur ligase family protein, partial [Pseudomonadota bacterium]
MDGYIAAKKRIFTHQTDKDIAVVGIDDPVTQGIAMGRSRPGQAQVIPISSEFGLARGVSAVAGHLFDSTGGQATSVGDLATAVTLAGRHNHQNAAAAFAVCHALGVSPSRIMSGLQSFPGLAHRMERVAEVGGVTFINDSKATNAQAAEQALRTYPKVHWIVGGVAKAEGIEPLEPLFDHVARAYLIGESAKTFEKTLKNKVPSEISGTLEQAVQAAFEQARNAGEPDPIVLLSPACASFDQFKDFEARGDYYRDIVTALSRTIGPQRVAAV